MSRGRTIAPAIVRRAEMRAPLKDLARNSDVGLAGVVAVAFRPATRIFRDATRFRRVGLVLGREPIAGPLPDIADHVVDAVAVRREGRHRRRAPKAGFALVRKVAVPGVRHRAVARHEFVTPGKLGVLEPAARGKLPLGFGRQILSGPSAHTDAHPNTRCAPPDARRGP